MNIALRLLVLLAAMAILAAPASAAKRVRIQDMESIAVRGNDYAPLTAQQVKALITGAATSLGWQIIESTEEKIRLQLSRDAYSVTIDLPYNDQGYGIYYVVSVGLQYNDNGKWRGIHSSYKRWIDNLTRAIEQASREGLPAKPAAVAEEKLD